MKKIISILFAILFLFNFEWVNAQNWTNAQISKANTAQDVTYLTEVEKECVLYINLCRLYPQDFLKYELQYYYGTEEYGDYLRGSAYRQSLIDLLSTMEPVGPLYFDVEAYNNAECFAIEQGEAGTTGHTRINCEDGNYAECCSYGMYTAKDIVMQLLIDHDVPGLGHRTICLDKDYTKIGVSVKEHKVWGSVAVIDMTW